MEMINQNYLLCSLIGIMGVSCSTHKSSDTSKKPLRPNILYIMSDDHTNQAIGIYGSRLARLDPTPNIDRIGKEGMVLNNCFCVNSISTPSRANIITGQYSKTNGVLDLEGKIDPKKEYLPMEMSTLGYQTAMIGKWHLQNEPSAFDYYCVLPGREYILILISWLEGPNPGLKTQFKKQAIQQISLQIWL